MTEAKITEGPIFRAINRAGRIAVNGFSPKVIWGVVKQACEACSLGNVAPHESVAPALGCATSEVASWSRSSSYSGTSAFRRRSAIWAARSGFAPRSMM
jgi:hypothetical protein